MEQGKLPEQLGDQQVTYNNQSSELRDQLTMQKTQLQGVLKVLEDVIVFAGYYALE